MRPMLTKKAQSEIEEMWMCRDEGMKLLDLVAAEFESDPMSVQCLDLRIVEDIKRVAKTHRELAKNNPLY